MPSPARDPSPIRRVTVRFTDRSHEVIEASAKREGVPFAQYVREAAIARAAWELGTRSGKVPADDAAQMAQALRDGFEAIREHWRQSGEG